MKLNKPSALICCVAGKSAGHILPCLTAAQALEPAQIIFFSGNGPLDHQLLAKNNAVTWHIPLPVHRTSLRTAWRLIPAFLKAFFFLLRRRPTHIISTGGLVSIPVCIAATLLRIPITLYELNVIPGKASKLLARLATEIRTVFAETKKHLPGEAILAPYPLKHITPRSRDAARAALKIPKGKKVLLVIGGSQGSQFLNEIVLRAIEADPAFFEDLHIMHQAGQAHASNVASAYQTHNVSADVFSFRNDLDICYAAADIVLCRSGAGTLFEIIAHKRPCITVPLITAQTSHQRNNAYAIQRIYPNLCTVLEQTDLKVNPLHLCRKIAALLSSHQRGAS